MKRKSQATTASKNKKSKNATPKASVESTPTKATLTAPLAAKSSTAGAAKPSAAANTGKKFSPLPLPTPLTGKFDLYATQLSFLHSEYLPAGAKVPNYQAVYDKILFYQAKPDFSFRCALRGEVGDDSTSQGRFTCCQVVNPISDEPLEPLCIVDGQTKESVGFFSTQSTHSSTVGNGWGYEAKIELDDTAEGCGCGMISSARGTFRLRKVWVAPGDVTKELFEGYWSLKVVYGPTLRRKGFGSGESYSGSFWGVRALKKDGEEVGIEAGDGTYMSTSSHGFISDGDDSDEFDGEDDYGFGNSEEEDDYSQAYCDY